MWSMSNQISIYKVQNTVEPVYNDHFIMKFFTCDLYSNVF